MLDLTDEEYQLLQEANQTKDWSKLTTFKLRYLYQRHIAFPAGRTDQVVEIGKLAAIKLNHRQWWDDKPKPVEPPPKPIEEKPKEIKKDPLPF